jgi:hypothetical protein
MYKEGDYVVLAFTPLDRMTRTFAKQPLRQHPMRVLRYYPAYNIGNLLVFVPEPIIKGGLGLYAHESCCLPAYDTGRKLKASELADGTYQIEWDSHETRASYVALRKCSAGGYYVSNESKQTLQTFSTLKAAQAAYAEQVAEQRKLPF